ncbi:MAG: cobalamin-binding protein [Thalassolituus sp.]
MKLISKDLLPPLLLTLGVSGIASAADTESAAPQRIVALAPHIVELLYSIGAGEQIIATTDYADFPPEAEKIPRAGSYAGLQVEKIIALKPDLILAWKSGNPEADLQRLEKYGQPVVYSDIVTLEDVAVELRRLGKLTGHSEKADDLATSYESELAHLRETYSNAEPVTVFYELWSHPLTTVAANAWPQQQLKLCGAENPFKDQPQDYPHISLEQVITQNPEVIIQPDHNGKTDINGIDWQRWAQLTAVKEGQIIHPDADKAHRMTLRALEATKALCEAIDQARQNKTAAD